MHTDRRLIKRFTEGEPEAVRELYRQYARPVFTVAFRALRDRGLAEEAVQQTFLQAWRASNRFDAEREVGPWLYTIARRVAVDLYRRERRHHGNDPLDREIAVLPPSFEGTWAAWEVRLALQRMPPAELDVIRSTHFLGLTHEETAEQLGIPLGTVKSRSHRAHQRLAEMLAHLEEVSA